MSEADFKASGGGWELFEGNEKNTRSGGRRGEKTGYNIVFFSLGLGGVGVPFEGVDENSASCLEGDVWSLGAACKYTISMICQAHVHNKPPQ